MTFDEVKKLQISNIIGSVPEVTALVKESLSIAASSTLKDSEISMWITAAVADMERQNIDVLNNLTNGLIQAGIVMYVKANFGYDEGEEKDRSVKAYKQLITNLSLSHEFKMEE